MKKLLTLIAFLPLFVFAQKGSYVLKLSKVEINGSPVGSIKIDSIKPSKVMTYISKYSDSTIDIHFTYEISSIDFDLENLSKRTIKVVWNDASYIDYNKNGGRIMHDGVKYIDRNNELPSMPLIADSKISDLAIPTKNVYYSSGTYGGWRKQPLLPSVGKKDEKTLIGKNVKLLLPINDGITTLDYVFTFDIVFNEYSK